MFRNHSAAPEPATAVQVLRSFDGGVVARQRVSRPETYRDLEGLARDTVRVVRGGGYSYAAAGFGGAAVVQDGRAFDRILDFDPAAGRIECEGGITLEKLYAYLAPRGWCLPVQPGYPKITAGGCVAADVHGKNQFIDGTFVRSVEALRLFHPSHGIINADRTNNSDVFALTCGGLGLTGQILSVRLRLQKLRGATVRVVRRRIERAGDTVKMLQDAAASTPLLYTWHNFTAAGQAFGSGFLYGGDFDEDAPLHGAGDSSTRPIDAESRGRLRVQLLNRYTARAFNAAYEIAQRWSPASKRVPLFDFLFPVARRVLFFELFGRRGFHEYQFIIPAETFEEFVSSVRAYIERHGIGVCLASAKIFRGTQSLLRFDGSGICMALDFPRDSKSEMFATFLDELLLRSRGLPNLVKDSRLPRAVVEACYAEYGAFKEGLRAYDPARLYRSELSERIAV